MAFEFKRKESLRKAVRRLSCGCVTNALESFHEDNKLEAVHSVRKEIKKLRALLRLIRAEIGEGPYKKRVKSLREASDYLAGPRDAHVQAKALRDLATHTRSGPSSHRLGKLQKALTQECQAEVARFREGGWEKIVRHLLCKQRAKFEKLKVRSKGWSLIGGGIMHSYAAGREAQELVRREPSAENFHEWRKRVKDLWYHVQLLQPVWPRQMAAVAERLEKLGECLGDDHDLHMLKQTATKKVILPELRSEAEKLTTLIDLYQRKLRAEALALGGEFYSEKPLIFCERIRRYWKAWRSKSGKRKKNAS